MPSGSIEEQPGGASVSYALPPGQVTILTEELLAARTMNVSSQHRFVTVEVDSGETYANLGRHIEREVFEAAFGNTADAMIKEYAPYEASSSFFLSVDRAKARITGVLRVIKNSPNGFKTLDDLSKEPFNISKQEALSYHSIDNLDEVWDVGTVAVIPDYRSGEGPVSIQLYRAMYLSAVNHSIEHLVSIIDEGPLKKMKELLGIPFVPLAGAEPQPYLGSESSQPVYGYVPEFYEKMSRHEKTFKMRAASLVGLVGDALKRLVHGSADDSIVLKD